MRIKLTECVLALLLAAASMAQAQGIDHAAWDSLVRQYVNTQHRVDYARLQKDALDRLDGYLGRLAAPWPANLPAAERKASLINAYNALTVRWVLRHYPVKSVWKTPKPFVLARHRVNGRAVSLDAIETELRNMGDPRIHSVLVCAARSCPPLRREAYTAETLDAQLDENTRSWLADGNLNSFDPQRRKAEVSSIFKWYKGDFEKGGETLPAFLAKYGPTAAAFLSKGGDVSFRDYDWGLNDAGAMGSGYSSFSFYIDYFWNKYFAR